MVFSVNDNGYHDYASHKSISTNDFVSQISQLTANEGGPFGIIHGAIVQRRIDVLLSVLPNCRPLFKLNGFLNVKLLKQFDSNGIGFDSISRHEMKFNRRCSNNRIELYSNPFKFDKDIKQACDSEVQVFTFDSIDDVHKIQSICKSKQTRPNLLLRMSGGRVAAGLIEAAFVDGFKVIGVSLDLEAEAGVQSLEESVDVCMRLLEVLVISYDVSCPIFHFDLDELLADHQMPPFNEVDRLQQFQQLLSAKEGAIDFLAILSAHDYFIRPSLIIAVPVVSINGAQNVIELPQDCSYCSSPLEETAIAEHSLLLPFFLSREDQLHPLLLGTEDGGFCSLRVDNVDMLHVRGTVNSSLKRGDWLFWHYNSKLINLHFRNSIPMINVASRAIRCAP